MAGMYDHVQPIIDSLPLELSDEQRQRAIGLLKRNADVFSRHSMDLGRTHLIDHVIDTGDHRPVEEPLRRHAKTHLGIIDAAVEAMLQSGIVERAASPWSSNVVVCTKKDGAPRITIDYRKLNNITYRDRWLLARISDCLMP